MTTLARRLRPVVEPAIAAGAFALWAASNASAFVTEIPIQSEYDLTNSYQVAIAVIGTIDRHSSVRSAILFGDHWRRPRYADCRVAVTSQQRELDRLRDLLVLLAFGLSTHASAALRRVSIVVALPIAAYVSVLLNVPAMSTTGMWGLINGKPQESADIPTGFAISAVVLTTTFSFAWYLGYLWRSRLARPANTSEQFDGAAGQSLSSSRNPVGLMALTPREREVYFLIAKGFATNEIAATAHIEESTVKSHISSVLSKLGLSSRTAVVAHAYRNGFLIPVPVD